MILVLVLLLGRCLQAPINRAQRVVFFPSQYWVGTGRVLKKKLGSRQVGVG